MSSSKEDAAVGSLVDPLASEAEAAQVAEMRAALHDEIDALPSRDFPDVTGDIRMLRFLRGFDHSVPQALAAVRDMLDTRRRYGLDALRRWADVPCHHIDGGFPHQEAVTRHKPGLPTVGLSHDGHVIAYEPLRLHRYAAMLEEIGEESMLEFYLAQCESRMAQLQRLSEEQGRMVKMVLVIDLRNVNVWQLTSRRWAKYDEAHQRAINRSLAEALAKVRSLGSHRAHALRCFLCTLLTDGAACAWNRSTASTYRTGRSDSTARLSGGSRPTRCVRSPSLAAAPTKPSSSG
jgi:hypothetical protein